VIARVGPSEIDAANLGLNLHTGGGWLAGYQDLAPKDMGTSYLCLYNALGRAVQKKEGHRPHGEEEDYGNPRDTVTVHAPDLRDG
jgi:hypothetical protein